MSRGFYIDIPRSRQHNLPPDPRFPIAYHIGWTRPTQKLETDWSTPEPDNYNRAILARKPIECEFVRDAVYYFDAERSAWWTVYCVPKDQLDQFDQWVQEQDYQLRWYQPHPAATRCRKGLLYNRKNGSEMTTEERLYTMGYYAKLSSKYFSDDDRKLLERLGPVRTELLNLPDFTTLQV